MSLHFADEIFHTFHSTELDRTAMKHNDFCDSILIVPTSTKTNNSKDDNCKDNSTIAITSAPPSAKNMEFNGFVGSEKRNPSSENDLFALERNSERKK